MKPWLMFLAGIAFGSIVSLAAREMMMPQPVREAERRFKQGKCHLYIATDTLPINLRSPPAAIGFWTQSEDLTVVYKNDYQELRRRMDAAATK